MRYSFASIKRVLSAYRRTAAVAAGVVLSLTCWVALDQPPGTKVWDFYTGAAIQSSAAIGSNGMIYFGTDSGKLYAFYPDGRGQWEFPTGDRIVASPAIGADGTIYVGGYNGIFYAIAPEGVERWRFRANGPIASSAAIGPDGTICFGTLNNRLFALRPDGSKAWDLAASDPVIGSPAVDAWGTMYVPSADGVLAAIDLRSGNVKWEFEAPNRILSSPAIGADGTIYFGCFDGHLYALDRLGKKRWTFASSGPVRGSAAIGPDGTIYFGSDDRQLYALAPDGIKKWTFTVGKWIRSTPAVAADGTVYIGSYDHSLYAVSPTGAKKWEFVTDNNVTASAAVVPDGTVYFGSWNGRFYAVRGDAELATAVWPRFRGDGRQMGYVGRTLSGELSSVAAAPEPTKPAAPAIVVRQEKGSVLGNWWRRLRGERNSEPATPLGADSTAIASTPPTSTAAMVPGEPVSESTTTVVAAAPAIDQPSGTSGTMTPVWQTPRRPSEVSTTTVVAPAVDVRPRPSGQPATSSAPGIMVRQEPGSVLGNWWRKRSQRAAAPTDGSVPAIPSVAPVDYQTTTMTAETVVRGSEPTRTVIVTNALSASREQAYQAQLEAMRQRVSNLEADLRAARAPVAPSAGPRVIADSRDLMNMAQPAPSTTVTTVTTVASPKEQEYEARIAAMKSRTDQLNAELARERAATVAVPVTKAPPSATTRPGMLPMMTLISVDEPVETPAKAVVPSPRAVPVSPAPKLDVAPPEANLQGVREIEEVWGDKKEARSSSSSWWRRSDEEEVKTSARPEVVTAREREYQPGFLQRTFGDREESGTDMSRAQPVEVTAKEREYQPGFLQRTFADRKESGMDVSRAQPVEVTAKEREYQPGFFQRMFSRDGRREPAAKEVKGTETTVATAEVAASDAVKVISEVKADPVEATVTNSAPLKVIADSEQLVAAETNKTSSPPTPVVTERESQMESRITALEKHIVELNAQLAQRDRDISTAPPVVEISAPAQAVADEKGKSVMVTPVVSEASTAKVIADSADLVAVSDEPKIEEVFVERKAASKPGQVESKIVEKAKVVAVSPTPTKVEVTERELQPGLLNRLFSRSKSDAGTEVTKVVAPSEPRPTEVEVSEREYRPGFFQRLFSRDNEDERSAVREISSTASGTPSTKEKAKTATAVAAVISAPASEKPKPVAKSDDELRPVAESKPSGFDAKLAKLDQQLASMRDELKETQRDRDDLKRQIGSDVEDKVVAVPKKLAAESVDTDDKSPAIVEVAKEDIDPALQKAYGDKVSQLESNLISLSEELASARVERARLREELENARRAATSGVAPVPVAPVRPSANATTGVEGTVIADSATLSREGDASAVIPQPEWLKQEVRSVIATADPWAQPPGAKSTIGESRQPAAIAEAAPAATSGVVEIPAAPTPEPAASREAKPAKRRKPGFFSRLFGRDDAGDEQVIPATNVVVVPPTVAGLGATGPQPTDAQLLGNDTGFAGGAKQTNFPRVAYSPTPGGSFFAPGVGNVTQLPGFPRQQPVLTPPPARAMDPTKVNVNAGLQNVEVRDTTTVVPPDAGVTRVEDLSVNRPVVAIMSPPDGATLPGPVLDLRGLAQGDRRIAQVLVSLDGGPFASAAGLERWSFQSPVNGNHVLVRVKAIDGSGRESAIVERTYGHRATSRLTVEVLGKGRVEPDLNGQPLTVGKPYEVTAVPAAGHEFVGWSGAADSVQPRLMFQMNEGLFLRAEFRPASPVAAAAPGPPSATSSLRGSYTGLLYPRELLQADRSGYFELRVEDDGAFTGQIRLATSAAPLRGRFDASGRGSQTIDRPGAEPITIRFTRENGGERITGYFDADGVPIVMRAYRSVPDGDTLSAITPGRYTLVIPGPPDAAAAGSPAGDGFGEVRIDAGGHVKFTGELPDGSKVTQESRISAAGVWPLYVPLYGGEGMLTGWISVTNDATLDLHGDLRWIKPAKPGDRFYPEGFASRRFVFGSIYQPAHDDLNKRKGLAGVLLGGNLGRLVLGQDLAALPLTSPERETLQQFDYRIDPDSGRVEGTFIHPETKQPTPFRGMLVQKRGWKSGYFMGADASGVVHLNGR